MASIVCTEMLKKWLILLVVLSLSFSLFYHVMNAKLNHNEHMYVAAGVLLNSNYFLYKDLAFGQTPYLAVLYGIIYSVTGTTHFLLIARAITFIFILLSAVSIYTITLRLSRSKLFSLYVFILFCLNSSVLNIAREASNYAMPLTYSVLSFFVFTLSVSRKRIKHIGVFTSGLFTALAFGSKIYYGSLILPYLLFSLFHPRKVLIKDRLKNIVLPLCLGFLIGVIPLIILLFSETDAFLINVVSYHFIGGLNTPLPLSFKLEYISKSFTSATNCITITGVFFLLYTIFAEAKYRKKIVYLAPEGKLAILLFTTSIITLLSLPKLYVQYLALSIPFPLILTACLYDSTSNENKKTISKILLLLLVIFLIYRINFILYTTESRKSEEWQGIILHSTAIELQETLNKKTSTAKY